MFINSGNSRYIQFVSTDYNLLEKVRRVMNSKHKIYLKRKGNNKWRNLYLLEIGSKEMYNDLLNLSLMPKKEDRLRLPKIPEEYLSHFIRGYFDGDGCISYGFYKKRNKNKKELLFTSRFISSSKKFLKDISKRLSIQAGLGFGCLSKLAKCYNLIYSKNDTIKLFYYMYGSIKSDLFLERKYKKFQEIFRILKGGGDDGTRTRDHRIDNPGP